MAQLRIKRSTGSTAPQSSALANAELAFAEGDETLYIGTGTSNNTAASVVKIGGKGAYCDLTSPQTIGGTKTFSGNVAVSGNLTVNGTTTTINTTNTTVSDHLMELNSGATSNSDDCGILIERGSTGDNAFIGWDESVDKFTVGTTTNTASTTGDLTNFTTGTLVAALEGNATTATTLQTARDIGGVSFNGSSSINLPGVNATGNQNTSGNAATATILANARTIGGVSFNGSANINLPGVNTTGTQNTSGNAATATTAGVATQVTASANNTNNETVYLTFVDAQTGSQQIESDSDLSYNPYTGVLSVGQIDGGTF